MRGCWIKVNQFDERMALGGSDFMNITNGRGALGPIAIALLIASILSSASTLRAQNIGDPLPPPGDTVLPARITSDLDVISLGLQFVPSPSGGSFFDEYTKLGGAATGLDGFTMPSLMLRLASSSPFRITLSGGYASGSFIDIYGIRDTTPGNVGVVSLVEELSVSAIPVMIGLEYAPVRTQFTTYLGVEAGVSFNTAEWTTEIREQTISEFYRPGGNTKGSQFFPAFRIYAGADYRFDRNLWSSGPFRGIFLEGSYLALPVVRDYFASIRRQGKGLRIVPESESGSLNLGGLTFTFGVNLQFLRQ
jgi:hypothetical protein